MGMEFIGRIFSFASDGGRAAAEGASKSASAVSDAGDKGVSFAQRLFR